MKRILLLLLALLLALCLGESALAEEKTDNFLDYGRAVANLGHLAGKGTDDVDMIAARLLLRAKEPLTNLESFGPLAIIAGPGNRYTVQFASEAEALACLEQLKDEPYIRYIQQDAPISIADETQEELLAQAKAAAKAESPYMSWGAKAMGADELADSIDNAGSITVAVVDSGVARHPFLNARVKLGGADFTDPSYKDGRHDVNGHGTHVAGTIVDLTQGLKVNILPVRVLGDNGSGSNAGVSNGIFYAAESGAKVINMSLGGGVSTPYGESALDDAVTYAYSKGVTVVVAAGNDNGDTATSSPANVKEAITVAALTFDLKKASYSNYGSAVDVAAPGSNIVSCSIRGGFTDMSGTSMASPHVAAIAAMVKLKNPSYSPSRVADAIKNRCLDLGDKGWDRYFGYGMPCFIESTDQTEGDYTYRLLPEGAALTGYIGSQREITLPAQIGGLNVVAIDANAFAGNKTLRKVTVPKNILDVGDKAFDGCSALETVALGPDVLKIGAGAFRGCVELHSVSLPDGLRDIDANAFESCAKLVALDLPENLQSLGAYAFARTGLTSLVVPGTVKTIPEGLFYGCAALSSLTLEEGVAKIGAFPFRECAALETCDLPESVTGLSIYAFYDSALKKITVPGGAALGEGVFYGVPKLREVVLSEGITTLPGALFMQCPALKKVTIPRSVAELGEKVFVECPKLTLYLYAGSAAEGYAGTNKIPYVSIGYQTLLTKLEPIQATVYSEPDQVMMISDLIIWEPQDTDDTFSNIMDMEWTVSNPEVVKFGRMDEIPIPYFTVIGVGETTLSATAPDGSGLSVEITLISNTQIPREVRLDKTELTLVEGKRATLTASVLPESADQRVTWLSGDESIATVDKKGRVTAVSAGVVTISAVSTGENPITATCQVTVVAKEKEPGDFAYEALDEKRIVVTGYNGSAAEVSVPAAIDGYQVVSIGERAFAESAVTAVKLPEGIETIEQEAFGGCQKLKSISLPDSLKYLARDAFAGCKKLPAVASLDLRVTKLRGGEPAFQLCPVFAPANTAATWSVSISPKSAAEFDPLQLAVVPKSDDYFRVTVTAGGKKAIVGFKGGQPYAASEVSIKGDAERTLEMGKTLKLTYKVTPASAEVVATWSSSNQKIATVDNKGVVTPVKAGKAKITLETDLGLKDTITVIVVKAAAPAKVSIEGKAKRTMEAGETLQLTYALEPAAAKVSVQWQSDNAKVVSVDENGLLTARKAGKATITVTTDEGESASVAVTVKKAEVVATKVRIKGDAKRTLKLGKTLRLEYAVTPAEATVEVRWVSSDPDIASVDENGLVTPHKAGKVKITLKTAQGLKDSVTITIKKK